MKVKTENELILDAIQTLEKKVDNLAEKFSNSPERLDNEIVAIITAAAYNLFGKRVAIKNIRLVDDNPRGKNKYRQFNVVAV
jgi:hypothetical protein